LTAKAWAQDRPDNKPTTLATEAAWAEELRQAGYDPAALHRADPPAMVALADLDARTVANRVMDRLAASSSVWTPHMVRDHVAALVTEAGVRATPEHLREWIGATADLALADCLTILPPDAPAPERVAYLTNLTVIDSEMRLRDLLAAATLDTEVSPVDVGELARERGLDDGQTQAAAAFASADPLVIVEGAAGSGKTSTLGVALAALGVAPPKLQSKNPASRQHVLRLLFMRTGGGGTRTAYGIGSTSETPTRQPARCSPARPPPCALLLGSG
jgi:hypothetical protein